jgi:hypothetical protein
MSSPLAKARDSFTRNKGADVLGAVLKGVDLGVLRFTLLPIVLNDDRVPLPE